MKNQEDWRQVMLTQYTIFGVIAGLEVTALALLGSLIPEFSLPQKILATIVAVGLSLEVAMLLWLINQERKRAWDKSEGKENTMRCFQENEPGYRLILNLLMFFTWTCILSLFLILIW